MRLREFQILLIDDDEDDFIYLRDLFSEIKAARYVLTWKSSYHEGLRTLQETPIDACLLDYRLGAETGLELLSETQRLGIRCPMILLTGVGDFSLDVRAMQVGAADYLVKDQVTAPLLERTIRYAIKHALDMDELRESKAQILQQDRLASLGLLASSLAHEIGTPLGIIRSRAELAASKAHSDMNISSDMQIITHQIDRISKLVKSLLTLARGGPTEQVISVGLNAAIADVLNLVRHELDRQEIEFRMSLRPDDLIVRAEPGPLGQVLLNLFVNSIHGIQAARDKGVDRPFFIDVSAQMKANQTTIEFTDNGCGIPRENLRHIFKPFFTTKDVGHGTGLGLATSYKLIQSWSGSIDVQSDGESGTTFRMSLPSEVSRSV